MASQNAFYKILTSYVLADTAGNSSMWEGTNPPNVLSPAPSWPLIWSLLTSLLGSWNSQFFSFLKKKSLFGGCTA